MAFECRMMVRGATLRREINFDLVLFTSMDVSLLPLPSPSPSPLSPSMKSTLFDMSDGGSIAFVVLMVLCCLGVGLLVLVILHYAFRECCGGGGTVAGYGASGPLQCRSLSVPLCDDPDWLASVLGNLEAAVRDPWHPLAIRLKPRAIECLAGPMQIFRPPSPPTTTTPPSPSPSPPGDDHDHEPPPPPPPSSPATPATATAEETMYCAICLDALQCGQEIRSIRRCRHAFHRDCLDEWLRGFRWVPLSEGGGKVAGRGHRGWIRLAHHDRQRPVPDLQAAGVDRASHHHGAAER